MYKLLTFLTALALSAGATAQLDTDALERALDNPDDDHTVGPFDPSLERNTDRFVLKFVNRTDRIQK